VRVRGVRCEEFDVCERVEKLRIAVDNLCIRVDKEWISEGDSTHTRSNLGQRLWVKIFIFISICKKPASFETGF
jgi:hypothetical protein